MGENMVINSHVEREPNENGKIQFLCENMILSSQFGWF